MLEEWCPPDRGKDCGERRGCGSGVAVVVAAKSTGGRCGGGKPWLVGWLWGRGQEMLVGGWAWPEVCSSKSETHDPKLIVSMFTKHNGQDSESQVHRHIFHFMVY